MAADWTTGTAGADEIGFRRLLYEIDGVAAIAHSDEALDPPQIALRTEGVLGVVASILFRLHELEPQRRGRRSPPIRTA